MRIDFVVTELFVGGAERCLTELAVGLAERGGSVRVFSLGMLPEGPQAVLLQRLQAAAIPVSSGDLHGFVSLPQCYIHLRRWLRQEPASICQTFLHHANVLGTYAARAEGIGNCIGGLRVAEPHRLRCQIERRAVAKMDRLVCVSEAVRRFAVDRLNAPEPITRVIPNGVDVTRFDRAQPIHWSSLDWPEGADVSLFVGRLHPQKGLELVQRQIDRIAPPGSNRRLLIVGDGPLREELGQWCQTIGADRVRLLGWQNDVAPLLRAARLLILPSHYEGMPNVVLEAMAAGRPVVCSRVEGSDELLAHEPELQSFPAGDDVSMATRIEQMLGDKSRAETIGRGNRQHVQQSFSIAAMIDAYDRVYRDLLSGKVEPS